MPKKSHPKKVSPSELFWALMHFENLNRNGMWRSPLVMARKQKSGFLWLSKQWHGMLKAQFVFPEALASLCLFSVSCVSSDYWIINWSRCLSQHRSCIDNWGRWFLFRWSVNKALAPFSIYTDYHILYKPNLKTK